MPDKAYDEEFETKKQIVKLLKGKYTKRLLDSFEKMPKGNCEFDGYWPVMPVKSTYHLLTQTLVYEPELTKSLLGFLDDYTMHDAAHHKEWIKQHYPNSDTKELTAKGNVDYSFDFTYFTSDETVDDIVYAEPLYIIINRYINAPAIFRVAVEGSLGEQGAYFILSLHKDTIVCENGDYRIESDYDYDWTIAANGDEITDEKEQKSIAHGICPICGGKLRYYTTFTW